MFFDIFRFRMQMMYQNPVGTFLRTVLFKWYMAIMIPAIWITYVVYVKLEEIGVISGVLGFITTQIEMLTRVATNCTGKILNMPAFLQCLQYTN